MMNFRKILEITGLLILGALVIHPQSQGEKIDLEFAVASALKGHPRIKQMETAVQKSERGKEDAFGNFLPEINLGYSFTHLNGPISIDLSPIRDAMITLQSKNQAEFANIYRLMGGGAPLTDAQKSSLAGNYATQLNSLLPEFKSTLKKQDYWTATITGVQPLFTGGKIVAANKIAELEYSAANLELQRVKNEITAEVINNYLNVVFLTELVKVRTDVTSGMKKHEERAGKMLAEGLIANYNYLRAKVAVSDAERNLYNDQKNLELAILALKNSMAIEENREIVVEDSLVTTTFLETEIIYTQLAKENHPLLKLIEIKKQMAAEKVSVDRSKFMPTIAAFGKYELYPEYLSAIEPKWAVGVSLNLNLFNGLQDKANLQSSKLLEKEIGYIEQDATSKINLLVQKQYRASENSAERFGRGSTSLELAEENLRLNEKRFDTGLGTSLEVVDARLMLEKNKIELKTALYEYYKNVCQLFETSGKPEDFLRIWLMQGEKTK
jgi:outer membrane protein TolC